MRFNYKIAIFMVAIVSIVLAMSGCTGTSTPTATPTAAPTAAATPTATPEATPAADDSAVLAVKGKVSNPLNLTVDNLKLYEQKTITVPGKDDVMQTYTGVSLNKLLDDAVPAADAAKVRMTGADGYESTAELSLIRSSTDAIVAINADNSLKVIVPGQSKGLWVGNLVSITVE